MSAVTEDSAIEVSSAAELVLEIAARFGGECMGHGGITVFGLGDGRSD